MSSSRARLSERAGTFLLLDAMRILSVRGKDCKLLLIGYFDDDAAKNKLRGYIKALALESNVEIRGRLDHESMSSALGEARIGVSPLQPIPKFLLNIPVKIFEYWACGLPVVASDLPPMRPFFRDGEAGLLFMQEAPSISRGQSGDCSTTPTQPREWELAGVRWLRNDLTTKVKS